MPLWRTTIKTPHGFSPQKQQAQVGDAIFWVNEDSGGIEHQPYPLTGQQSTWCSQPLVGPEPSSQINLGSPGTIEYRCWFHPDETATIVVANAVQIGRTADDKIAFVPNSEPINVGESVSWSNSDMDAHWPAPVGGANDAWLPAPVASGEVSQPVAFPAAGTMPYRCAVEGHNETGTIVVNHLVSINASGSTASFDPGTVDAALNDPVWWLNNDPTNSHWPAPDSGPNTAWFKTALKAGAQSSSVTMSTAGTIGYRCALHPSETGTIIVS